MKNFSLFLVFYLFTLTITPAFVSMFPCAKAKTEKSCINVCMKDCKKKENSNGNDSNCPFNICCSNCLFYNVEQGQVEFLIPSVIRQKITSAAQNLFSSYIADCWHPPEIV
jgi:hypothetical protein